MASWFRRSDGVFSPKEDKDDLGDIEFKPEKLQEELNKSIDTKFAEMSTRQEASMKPITEMLAALNKEREDKAEVARKASEKKNKEESELTMEDYMVDPMDATRRQLQPVAQATMMLAARMAKQDTLGEKEFYYGATKEKVDILIASLPLNQQSNPGSLENCYKIVMFDLQKDIADGKLKARNSSAMFESSGTGGHSGADKGDAVEVMSEDEKRAARAFGLTEKQWTDSRKELTYV